MINVDSLITDLKCLGEVAEAEDIRVEGNPLHGWVNEAWQALESLQQQLADMERKLVDAQDAVLIGTAILSEIISADEAALAELSGMRIPVPEPVLTAKARCAVAQMIKAIEQSKGGDDAK